MGQGADRQHRRYRPAGGVDPQCDVRIGILVGQGHELGDQQRAIVVVQDAVQDEDAALEESEPRSFGESSRFIGHVTSVRERGP